MSSSRRVSAVASPAPSVRWARMKSRTRTALSSRLRNVAFIRTSFRPAARCRASCRRVLTSPDARRPYAITGPAGLTVERGLWARFCPRARTKTLHANGRFPGSGPLFVERTPGIAGRSARTLESGRLMVVTSALPDGTRPRIAGSGRLTVGTDALTGRRRPRTPASDRLTVGTDALTGGRWPRTPASGRLTVGTDARAGGRRPHIAGSARLTVGTDALAGRRRPRTSTSGRLTVGSRALAARIRPLAAA